MVRSPSGRGGLRDSVPDPVVFRLIYFTGGVAPGGDFERVFRSAVRGVFQRSSEIHGDPEDDSPEDDHHRHPEDPPAPSESHVALSVDPPHVLSPVSSPTNRYTRHQLSARLSMAGALPAAFKFSAGNPTFMPLAARPRASRRARSRLRARGPRRLRAPHLRPRGPRLRAPLHHRGRRPAQ